MEIVELKNKDTKNCLTCINRIARAIYTEYNVVRNYIFPTNSGVKDPNVFETSFFVVSKSDAIGFLNNQVVYPSDFTKALNDRAISGEHVNGWLLKGKNDNFYQISRDIGEDDKVIETNKAKMSIYFTTLTDITDGKYTYKATLDDTSRALLHDGGDIEIELTDGKNSFPITVVPKILPAIKPDHSVLFYGKKTPVEDSNIYRVVICTIGPDWSFYSRHYVLPY